MAFWFDCALRGAVVTRIGIRTGTKGILILKTDTGVCENRLLSQIVRLEV